MRSSRLWKLRRNHPIPRCLSTKRYLKVYVLGAGSLALPSSLIVSTEVFNNGVGVVVPPKEVLGHKVPHAGRMAACIGAKAINRWGELSHKIHHTRASLPHLYLFTILSSFIWSKTRSFIWELVLWRILGMNNMKISLMFLLSYYQYSYAYELELSSYVIHLAYRTLCLILHTYMFRSRPELR
jgi:hypothetical protein